MERLFVLYFACLYAVSAVTASNNVRHMKMDYANGAGLLSNIEQALFKPKLKVNALNFNKEVISGYLKINILNKHNTDFNPFSDDGGGRCYPSTSYLQNSSILTSLRI